MAAVLAVGTDSCDPLRPVIPRLHLITDDRVLARPDFPVRAAAALEAGRDRVTLHLRGPRHSGRDLWEVGTQLLPEVRTRSGTLLVNDRIDVARALGADGVHLGMHSFLPVQARAMLVRDALIGLSAHAGDSGIKPDWRAEGPPEGVDFLIVGTLFSTESHPGRVGVGIEGLRTMIASARGVPVLGIGGVTPARVSDILAAGAHGVAVIRSVWDAEDSGAAVAELLGEYGWDAKASGAITMSTGEQAAGEGGGEILLRVNGAERRVLEGLTVQGLLEQLELIPATVVVEHNLEILDRASYARVVLHDGDRLELVHFVGGG